MNERIKNTYNDFLVTRLKLVMRQGKLYVELGGRFYAINPHNYITPQDEIYEAYGIYKRYR